MSIAQTVYASKYNASVFVWEIEIVVLVLANTSNETEAYKTEFSFNQVIIPKEKKYGNDQATNQNLSV